MLRLPPDNKAHATVMQPLQCVLQQHVPIHAAITMRFASTPCKTPSENRLRPKRSNRTCRTHTHTKKVPFTFIAACSHFTRKNTRFRAPASSPQQAPCNSHAAITMRPCSHYNAICIHTLQNTTGEPITPERIQTAPAAHTRYPSSLPAATLHRKTRGFVLRLPQAPCNIHAAPFVRCILLCDVFCCVVYSCVMYCCVMYCCVMYCYVMYCCVMYCCVVYCYAVYCYVMYC